MTKTRRFSPPYKPIGSTAPFNGLEQYDLDELTDQQLVQLIRNEYSPRWLVNEARLELESRTND
jgi:hypothetical protein